MLNENARIIGELLEEAFAEAGIGRKEGAHELGMDPAQMSRWLSGGAHQLADRLLNLDPRVLRLFAAKFATRCGCVVVSDPVLDLVAALCQSVGTRRMVKAGWPAPIHAHRRVG